MIKYISSLLIFLCIGLNTSKAQYVDIPDTLFGFWLDSMGYGSCLTGNNTIGWQMDTTCSLVRNTTTIDCSNYGIKDLTGITYFDNLANLFCGGKHSLSYLPPLPVGLTQLVCPIGNLSSLPDLPPSLNTLLCYDNHITALPAIPNTVRVLICDNNDITNVPNLPTLMSICSFSFNSNLRCLPKLNQISNLYFTNTANTC